MKIVFFGTPEFSVPTLNAIINSHHQLLAVVTQPDKPVGRAGKVVFSPAKQIALNHNIPVYQFEKIKLGGGEQLKKLNADVFVTAAYGQILDISVLTASKFGVFNVHGSLLPKYRGASPIQCAVINGETTTGITILKSEIGMDDGDIILQKQTDILKNETSAELFVRLAELGAQCLLEALKKLENGTITYTPQNHAEATRCKMLKKQQSTINFNQPATTVVNLIHGLNPWPMAEINTLEGRFKLYKADELNQQKALQLGLTGNEPAGQVVVANPKQGLIIRAQNGYVQILEMQAEGGKTMPAKNLLNGKQIKPGQIVNE